MSNVTGGIRHMYHQGYDAIYNADYEFGFVFIDEDEVDDEEVYEEEEPLVLH